MKKLMKRFACFLLTMIMLSSLGVEVYAAPGEVGSATAGIKNGGSMKCPAYIIRLKEVPSGGALTELETYDKFCYGKYDESWWKPGIVDDVVVVTAHDTSNWNPGTCEYAFENGQQQLIHGSRVFASRRGAGARSFSQGAMREAVALISSGAQWQAIVNNPCFETLAKEFASCMVNGTLVQALDEAAGFNQTGASDVLGGYAYVAIATAAMKLSNNQLSWGALTTLYNTLNAAGSEAYVFIEINSAAVTTESVIVTYPTYYGTAFGISASEIALGSVGIDYKSNPAGYKKAYAQYIEGRGAGRSRDWIGGPSGKYVFFRYGPFGQSGTDWNWGTTTVQVNPRTLAADGAASSTYLGTFITGDITFDTEGMVYIKANPKNQAYTPGSSVTAELTLDVLNENAAQRGSQIAKWVPGTKIELNLSKVNKDGTTSNDATGTIVDTTSVGTKSGNKITIVPSSKAEFTSWVDGTKKVNVTDSGLSSEQGFTIEYQVTANFVYPTETKTASARGVEKKSPTVAADSASWVSTSPDEFFYHSSAGEEHAMGEVKNNTPNNENWEAMGGIPTTETTYIAAGGQTHQVDFSGRIGNNPSATRTVSIVVNIKNCWGNDEKCKAVCDGHSHTSPGGGCVVSPAVPADPGPPSKPGKPAVYCTSQSMTNTFLTQSQGWSVSCSAGSETNSGTDNHSWQGSRDHEDKYCDDNWGEHCNNTTNHTHVQSHTYTYNIQIPIDAFNYLNMTGLDTNYLNRMNFDGNSALFTNPTASVTGAPVVTNFFDTGNYASGNGRIYFDYDQKKMVCQGNAIYKWGDGRIEVTVNSGATSLADAGHSEPSGSGTTYAGAKDDKCIPTADRIAEEIRKELEAAGPYKACAVSDYAEIGYNGNMQTVGYYEQISIPANWYAGISLPSGGGTVVASNGIKWDKVCNGGDLWYSNPFRTLWGASDVATYGYNGNYSQVNNVGGMSGKFLPTGSHTWGKYAFWAENRKQPNTTAKQHGSNTQQVPLSATGINILRTYKNGQVSTGKCTITYTDAVAIGSPGNGGFQRNNTMTCNYTAGQNGINDIVIHDPVSVQYSEVLCNDKSLDQRTDASKILQGGDDPNKHDIYRDATTNTVDPGIAFINIGKNFKIRVSNKGDFAQSHTMGLASCTFERQGGVKSNGKTWGFVDGMDCTQWTKERFVIFPVHVDAKAKNGKWYSYYAGYPIELDEVAPSADDPDVYEFYVTTNSDELARANATFVTTAINGPKTGYYDESNGVTNKLRVGDKAAKHTATKNQKIDVVGFIGNLAINDTGDFRFAELFKQKSSSGDWLIKNLVHEVDYKKPNQIVADPVDILQNKADASTKYHSTFGITYANTGGKAYPFKLLPLTPSDNPIVELQNQEMRPGYNLYMDVETIGRYYGENFDEVGNPVRDNLFQRMVIKPRYWSYDLDTDTYTPIDVYYGFEGSYNLIVPFDSDAVTYNSEWLYYLDWANESARRNYVELEKTMTESVVQNFKALLQYSTVDIETGLPSYFEPKIEGPKPNKEKIGSANTLYLDSANRTFIGSSKVYQQLNQVGDNFINLPDLQSTIYADYEFGRRSQRWQYTIGLPSSTVFVKQGEACTKTNIEALQNTNSVVICALDIKVQGEIWALEYDGTAVNFADGKGFEVYPGKIITPPKEPGTNEYIDDPIVVVYNNKYTSEDDLRTEGTH